jgi:hypothetical protein
MKLAFLSIVVLLGGAVDPAAQVFTTPPPPPLSMPDMIWNSHVMRQLGTNAAGQAVFAEQLKRDLEKRNQASAGKPSTQVSATPAYSSKLSYPFAGQYVLATRIAESPDAANAGLRADQLNSLIGSLFKEYQTSFQEEHERLRMPVNDVASAMTYCVVMSYMTLNGLSQLEAVKSVAVYQQASRLFLDNAEFAKFSATDRQMLAEVLVAVGGMPGLTLRTTRDAAQAKKIAESTLVRLFGKDGGKVRITENGLEF